MPTTDNITCQLLTPTERFLNRHDILELTKWSRTTLWKMIRTGHFPAPVNTGLRNARWRATDVNHWINNLVQEQQ